MLRAVTGLDDPEVWRPAEEAALVRVEKGDVRLRHPLIRFAIHQAASFADRREAHLALAAAVSAMYAGYPQWVGEIAARVGTLTNDPEPLAQASLCGGWSLSVTLRHQDALGFLLPVAESMATNCTRAGAGRAGNGGHPRLQLRRPPLPHRTPAHR
ncbi:hypothetical protein AW27_030265 [Streptomyces sp. PCS3-D2]|uniref:hypothetical protein n=1 Tax=Streptomyces sp. PCS3-D2 TaxID=1460244 RepID=UPI0004464460|nr:hypothetical protein [Streptomyces sp. PCS3-D2]WKV75429.1 hypothetical protein AW27_030265 [Streptomyces sp. PCS3-D2]